MSQSMRFCLGVAAACAMAFAGAPAFADAPPELTPGNPDYGKSYTLPAAPLEKNAGDVNVLLRDAEAEGGIGLDSLQREIHLPGLKRDDPSLRATVLHTRNGVNEVVTLSSLLLNRIATPFKNPTLIDTTEADHKIVGGDVYYRPEGRNPVGLYIVDAGNPSQVISLTVMPDPDIPGQNLLVKLEDLRAVDEKLALAAAGPGERAIATPSSSDYSNVIRAYMANAVRGEIPGFNPMPLEGGAARMGDLLVTPDVVFAGSVLDIYRYRIQAMGAELLDLLETAFYREGVKAVSFFPKSSLQPNETSYVFLLADKPASQGDAN